MSERAVGSAQDIGRVCNVIGRRVNEVEIVVFAVLGRLERLVGKEGTCTFDIGAGCNTGIRHTIHIVSLHGGFSHIKGPHLPVAFGICSALIDTVLDIGCSRTSYDRARGLGAALDSEEITLSRLDNFAIIYDFVRERFWDSEA